VTVASVRDLLRDAKLPGESPRLDAEILLCHCLGKPRSWLYTWPEHEVIGASLEGYRAMLERRRAGEPVAYLTGSREFWSLSLEVDASTLIPRPETESLVARALQLALPGDARVLDLGTGSGAIALALASECPGWRVSGVDANPAAVALARRNALRLDLERVSFIRSDWFSSLAGERFHLVVGNPPYVAPGDPHLERGDLRFEPHSALVAADGGLADLREIIRHAGEHLEPGGWLLLEHGCEQGAAVRELLRAAGYAGTRTSPDLAGLERVSEGQWRAQ